MHVDQEEIYDVKETFLLLNQALACLIMNERIKIEYIDKVEDACKYSKYCVYVLNDKMNRNI